MSTVKLYKNSFEKKHGWIIDSAVGEVEGRFLMRVNIGEKVCGDHISPLQIDIYEELLQLLVDETDKFQIYTGRKDYQTTIVYAGELLEFNSQKKRQYDLLKEELQKKKYSIKRKIDVFQNLVMNEMYGDPILDDTKDFMGTVNIRLNEEHLAVVFRYMLFDVIKERIQKIGNITLKKREASQYLQSLPGKDLVEFSTEIIYTRTQIHRKDDVIQIYANMFGVSKKYFIDAIKDEVIDRIYKNQISIR